MSIPYVVDGETDLDSALFNPIIDRANGTAGPLASVRSGAAYALDYADSDGFDPTGNDDSGPSIIKMVTDLDTAGGGTLILPPGDIRIAPQGTVSGLRWGIPFPALTSNITIQGAGPSTRIIFDLPDAGTESGLFHLGGGSNWAANDLRNATLYDLGADALRGSTSLTLDTAADAGAFAPGDWIFIRTGQTLDFAGEWQPDSEINQVISADAGTGVIVPRWATTKPYALENVDTGNGDTYRSVVGGAGDPLPFGVANVTDLLCTNLTFRDFHVECDTASAGIFMGAGIVGLQIQNISADIIGNFTSGGNDRRVRVDNVTCQQRNSASTYFVAPSTGSTDYVVSRCDVSSTDTSYLHIHEGVSQYKAHGNTIRNTHVAADRQAVSIRARAYDIQITGNTFINAGTSAAVYVDALCTGGGIVANNYVEYRAGSGIAIDAATGWVKANNSEVLVS